GVGVSVAAARAGTLPRPTPTANHHSPAVMILAGSDALSLHPRLSGAWSRIVHLLGMIPAVGRSVDGALTGLCRSPVMDSLSVEDERPCGSAAARRSHSLTCRLR